MLYRIVDAENGRPSVKTGGIYIKESAASFFRQLGQCSLIFSAMPDVGSVEECEVEGLRVSRSCLGGVVVRFCTATLLPLADCCREHHGCVASNVLMFWTRYR